MFDFAALSLLLASGVLCLNLEFVGVFPSGVFGVAVKVFMGVLQCNLLLGVETNAASPGIIVLRQSSLFESSFWKIYIFFLCAQSRFMYKRRLLHSDRQKSRPSCVRYNKQNINIK